MHWALTELSPLSSFVQSAPSAKGDAGAAWPVQLSQVRGVADRSNARTAHFKPDVPIPTLITINPDRTFSFTFKTPPVSYLLKKAAKIEKGSGAAGSDIVGEVSLKHVYEIAKVKCMDDALKALGEERVARSVIGSARSLGIKVVP